MQPSVYHDPEESVVELDTSMKGIWFTDLMIELEQKNKRWLSDEAKQSRACHRDRISEFDVTIPKSFYILEVLRQKSRLYSGQEESES